MSAERSLSACSAFRFFGKSWDVTSTSQERLLSYFSALSKAPFQALKHPLAMSRLIASQSCAATSLAHSSL